MATQAAEKHDALTVWANDTTHDFYYPPSDLQVPDDPVRTGPGRAWDEADFAKKQASLAYAVNKNKPPHAGRFPIRTKLQPLDSGSKKAILTNHFQLKTRDKELYEYEILDLDADGPTRKKIQALFRKAVDTWPFLNAHQDSFATDGQKTIVSWKSLHSNMDPSTLEAGASSTWRRDLVVNSAITIPARFSFVGTVDVAGLIQQSESNPDQEKTDHTSAERCLNILIAKSFDASVVRLSGKKFYVRKARANLGSSTSLEIIRGYHYAVRPGMGNLLMNFNVATSAFFRPILVSEFLADRGTFSSDWERQVNLKTLRVYVEFPHSEDRLNRPGARIKKIKDLGPAIGTLSFRKVSKDAQGHPIRDITQPGGWQIDPPTQVVDHLMTVFGQSAVPGRKAVNVGSAGDPVYYAQEMLRIIPYQLYTRPVPDRFTRNMVEMAALDPGQSQWLIENEGLSQLGFANAKNEEVQFTLKYFVIHSLDSTVPVAGFETELQDQMLRRCNTKAEGVVRLNASEAASELKGSSMELRMKQAKESEAELAVLLLQNFDRSAYAEFKNLADRKYGLRSLCLAKPALFSNSKYMSNVAQKINIKFGGVNSYVAKVKSFLETKTLVLGADLVHPPAGALEDTPSIACMVGSIDNHGGCFPGSARLQSKDRDDREIIDEENIMSMVKERIKAWRVDKGGLFPLNIIYYRDGVSEGHYQKVVSVELKAIRRAWREAQAATNTILLRGDKDVKLTALVGVKRHHTRFYPMTDKDADTEWGNNNCLPGTYVDRVVTSPYYRDFYLQSHSGVKGTARPTHYFMLADGKIPNCTTIDQLRTLTHSLCYTYCRATGGISYAAPTYYADRLCDRARLYLPESWAANNVGLQASIDTARTNHSTARQNNRDLLYRQVQQFNLAVHNAKSNAELADEAQDEDSLRAFTKDFVIQHAKNEFYEYKTDQTGNPWHESLDRIMFWM
ncbi:uncharacterized protein J4E78_001226 [Alternaria triticimaculans]|uniref:uncharacterized protein n=1 Tax=Alternaria triticimaculans TaxID=297637 RepID=UPI0020C351ED|nr:uncharacterized protein J4E78_001226 [Alternaria triticimaculans]KAI4672724.1 hypothetical protein J4E78_001226 [Alternaria triticimaculans]